MNGEIAEVCANKLNAPNKTKIMMIGKSQNRLRTLRKSHNSFKMDTLDKSAPPMRFLAVLPGTCRTFMVEC